MSTKKIKEGKVLNVGQVYLVPKPVTSPSNTPQSSLNISSSRSQPKQTGPKKED